MHTAIIVDIDGTLADTISFAGSWTEGVETLAFDIRPAIVNVVREMAADNIVVICTARNIKHLSATQAWLRQNNIPCDILRMRVDWGSVSEFKAGVVEEITKAGIEVTTSFDDDRDNNEVFEDFGFINVVEV